MCTVWSDSVGEARGREKHERARGGLARAEVDEADTHPPSRPSAALPAVVPRARLLLGVASPRAEKKKKGRDGGRRAEKESTADAGSLPGSLLNPDPEFSSTSLTLSLGCGSFAYGRGQNHPTGLRTLDLAGFGRLARTPSLYVSLPVSVVRACLCRPACTGCGCAMIGLATGSRR